MIQPVPVHLQVCCPRVIVLVQAEAQTGQVLQLLNLKIKLIPNNKEFWGYVTAVLQNDCWWGVFAQGGFYRDRYKS